MGEPEETMNGSSGTEDQYCADQREIKLQRVCENNQISESVAILRKSTQATACAGLSGEPQSVGLCGLPGKDY